MHKKVYIFPLFFKKKVKVEGKNNPIPDKLIPAYFFSLRYEKKVFASKYLFKNSGERAHVSPFYSKIPHLRSARLGVLRRTLGTVSCGWHWHRRKCRMDNRAAGHEISGIPSTPPVMPSLFRIFFLCRQHSESTQVIIFGRININKVVGWRRHRSKAKHVIAARKRRQWRKNEEEKKITKTNGLRKS